MYRLAVPGDARCLAGLHYECATELEDSFMASLGVGWLKAYYDVVLSDPHCVIVAAFDRSGELLGFSSGSLDTAAQLRTLREQKLQLFLSAVPAIARRPRLLAGLTSRYRTARDGTAESYVLTSGPRADFLAWRKSQRNGGGAFALLCAWYGVMRALNCGAIAFEVDAKNTKGQRFHRFLGAVVLYSFKTSDNKERFVMQYPNNTPRFD